MVNERGLKALEYSRLRASGNPEKSRDEIFKNPGIEILKKSQDPGISRDPAGAWLPLPYLDGSLSYMILQCLHDFL